MNTPLWALVRFTEDEVLYTCNVERFSRSTKNMKKNYLSKVRWKDGRLYEARILELGDEAFVKEAYYFASLSHGKTEMSVDSNVTSKTTAVPDATSTPSDPVKMKKTTAVTDETPQATAAPQRVSQPVALDEPFISDSSGEEWEPSEEWEPNEAKSSTHVMSIPVIMDVVENNTVHTLITSQEQISSYRVIASVPNDADNFNACTLDISATNSVAENINNEYDIQDNTLSDTSDCQGGPVQSSGQEPPKITVQESKNVLGCRKWDKRHACLFCGVLFAKLPRHLESAHPEETEVQMFLAQRKGSKERFRLIETLRNEGNYLYNGKVLGKGEGTIIPKRRANAGNPKAVSEYLPCSKCHGYFYHKDIAVHIKKCKISSKDPPKKQIKAHCSSLLPNCKTASVGLVRDVLSTRNHDKVYLVMKTDDLILEYGSNLYSKYGAEPHQWNFIGQKMRELGRFLLSAQSLDNKVTKLSDLIHPQNFDLVVEAVKKVSNFNETTHECGIPSLATKLGSALKQVAGILQCKMIMSGSRSRRDEINDFIELMDKRWNVLIAQHAQKTQYKRTWNKPAMLPLSNDIKLLNDYLKARSLTLMNAMKEKATEENWNELCATTLAQTLTFNRRRAGEVERIHLSTYLNRDKNPIPDDVVESLSEIEKHLAKQLTRFETRGKRGRKVPILLTADLCNQISMLCEKRRLCNIPDDNLFLFGKVSTTTYVRACDVMRTMAKQCGAKEPSNLTSTKLRKHVATVSQLLNLKNNELDQLATYMGHDIRVHREYYRLPESHTQITKISKILLSLDTDNIKTQQGSTLDNIQIDTEKISKQTVAVEEINALASTSSTLQQTERENILTQEITLNWHGELHESDDEHSSPPKKRKTTKVPWTLFEKEAVLRQMNHFIVRGIVPGREACEKCIRNEPVLKSRTWKNVKYQTYNSIKTRKRTG